jgi:hypothetical protein
MITTGTVIVKFVEHIALSDSSGMWQYSVVDRVASADKPTWHKIQQYYENTRPDPKRVGTAYKVRILKSKRERFKDRDGVWQDKGEVFIIDGDGWANADDLNATTDEADVINLNLLYGGILSTVADIMNLFPGESQIYVVEEYKFFLITRSSGIINYEAVAPFYKKPVRMIESFSNGGYLIWLE